ncbi:cache domain-containing protein [Arcobacter sp. LA11]|uniref:sensor histidine kinase n=1 Tax=Arcobacter sp. LA11 TaxID=1898176 RepID=UPI000934240C|nr:cache domain-containing protein [Arcobacter sp. LA11]
MNLKENENIILQIIRYTPSIFIFLLTIITTYYLTTYYKNEFLMTKTNIIQNYIDEEKNEIRISVESLDIYIDEKINSSLINLKKSLQTKIDNAYIMINSIYNKNYLYKSKANIIQQIKNTLRDIRFDEGKGYFYIFNLDGTNVLHPINPENENRNLLYDKDIKSIIKKLKDNNQKFIEYYFFKPDLPSKKFKKFAFVKKFEPYNWIIGTGKYLDNFNTEIKNEILSYLKYSNYKNNTNLFIFNTKGEILANNDKSLIGGNIYSNNNFNKIIPIFNKFKDSKDNSIFIEYKRAYKTKNIKKIMYLKKNQKYNWIIASEFNLDNANKTVDKRKVILEKQYSEYRKMVFYWSIAIFIILLSISIYISNILKKIFLNYRKKVKIDFEKQQLLKKENEKKQKLLYQQSKMAAMGEMIGNIAHQWRQPLSVILTASTGIKMQKELSTLPDKELFSMLDTINNSVHYLSQTIEDFRTFFNPKVNNPKSCSTHDIFERTFKLIDIQFSSKNIKIIKNIQDIRIVSFENELIQVLINILNNSRDALVEKETDEKLIFIDCYKKDDFLFIEIKDNAEGINEEIMDRVFEPYFTTKHQSQGTGIGLYMSMEIVQKLLNGKIKVKNENYTYNNQPSRGAKFIIEINTIGE